MSGNTINASSYQLRELLNPSEPSGNIVHYSSLVAVHRPGVFVSEINMIPSTFPIATPTVSPVDV